MTFRKGEESLSLPGTRMPGAQQHPFCVPFVGPEEATGQKSEVYQYPKLSHINLEILTHQIVRP